VRSARELPVLVFAARSPVALGEKNSRPNYEALTALGVEVIEVDSISGHLISRLCSTSWVGGGWSV
jgi:hypothetical protein